MQNDTETQLNIENKFRININNLKNPVQISSGTFGSVYLVQDKETEEYFEAKVLTHGHNNPKYKQAIIREIRIIIHVQHPTLIKFHGYSLNDFEGNNNITVLMDYPTNGSLSGAIKNKQNILSNYKYDNTARQIILVGISYGMMHLHRYHIVHPCLSPNNILLDKDLKPWITNFCLTRFFEKTDSKDRPENIDSLIYKAPEVILTNTYNHRSDVYSFGILMYEILTESVPYPIIQENNKISIDQFKEKVVHQNYRPEFKTPIKKSIKQLIERCWSKSVKERPTFEEIFNKLAFNIEDSIYDIFDTSSNENSEIISNKFYLDGIDTDRLQSYINEINQNDNSPYQNEIEKLRKKLEIVEKENKRLKNQLIHQNQSKKMTKKSSTPIIKSVDQITIQNFNKLPIKCQQRIIGKIIQNTKDDTLIQSLTNLNNLLLFLMQFHISSETVNYIQLLSNSSDEKHDNMTRITENNKKLRQVYVLFNATEILYLNKSLDSFHFRSILGHFDEVLVEIKHPSNYFKEIFETILNIKSATKTKLKIGLFVYDIQKVDEFSRVKTDINSIRVDQSVNVLPANSFSEYSSLTSIRVPDSVSLFEDNCFEKCKFLREIEIPTSVKSIGKRCFCGCSSLREIIIPKSVETVGTAAFKDCLSLQKVTILSTSLKTIEDGLFLRCSSLFDVSIPSSVKSIGRKSFGDCSSLVQIEIPASVSSIGRISFEGCFSLEKVLISEPNLSQLSIIEEAAFSGCRSLFEMTIPSSVVEIGWNVFNGCSSLKQISIPSSVKEIKYNVFNGCTSLKCVTIDPYKTKYSTQVFDNLSSLIKLKFGHSVNSIHFVYYLFEKFRKISLPESVMTIDKNGFSGCQNLREIFIPDSVTIIGDSAFFGCSNLTKVIIPSSVTSIGSSAFSGCSSLTKISIPSSVILIGKNAFYGCTSLIQISILSSFTSIGESCFQGCSSLTQIKICTSVNSIGSGAFSGCSSLNEIQIPYALDSIKKSNKYELLGIDKKVKIVTF